MHSFTGVEIKSMEDFVRELQKACKVLPITFSVLRYRPDPPGGESGAPTLAGLTAAGTKSYSEPDEVFPAGLAVAPGLRGRSIVPNPLRPSSEPAPVPPPDKRAKWNERNYLAEVDHLANIRRQLADMVEDDEGAEMDQATVGPRATRRQPWGHLGC